MLFVVSFSVCLKTVKTLIEVIYHCDIEELYEYIFFLITVFGDGLNIPFLFHSAHFVLSCKTFFSGNLACQSILKAGKTLKNK